MTESHTRKACHAVRTPFPPLNPRAPRSNITIHKSGKSIRETYSKYLDVRQGLDLVRGDAMINKAESLLGQGHEN